MENKKIFTVDLVVIIGTFLVLIVLIGYSTPLVISPINENNKTKSDVLFSIKKTDKLFIDDNINFSSQNQYLLKDGFELSLNPGIYYFKTVSNEISEIKTLTVETKVTLELKENQNHYDVINAGVTSIDVLVYDRDSLVYETELKSNKNKFFWGKK